MRKSRKQTQLLAYLGGFFDGEGSVGVYAHGGTFKLTLNVANYDPFPLCLLLKEFPGGILAIQPNDLWIVRYNHYKAQDFLEAILPYTLIKHEQIKVGISFLNHRRRDHRDKKMGPNCSRCRRYAEAVRNLKHRQRVNSVKPHEMRQYRAKPEEVEEDRQYAISLLEGVETRAERSTRNKANSAREKDIVHT